MTGASVNSGGQKPSYPVVPAAPVKSMERRTLQAQPAGSSKVTEKPGRVPPAVVRQAFQVTETKVKAKVVRSADTVELTRVAFDTAWRQISALAPGVSAQERSDAAMAVAGMTFLHRQEVENLAKVDSGKTQVISYMRDTGVRPDHNAFALDRTMAKGTLDPKLSDGTDGQVSHTGFFVLASYVAAGKLDKMGLTFAASVLQETPLSAAVRKHKPLEVTKMFAGLEGVTVKGASMEDFRASILGMMAGDRLRQLRDAGKGHLNGTLLANAMAREGTFIPKELPDDHHKEALAEANKLREDLKFWDPFLENPVARNIIGPGPWPIAGLLRALRGEASE
jgi:hypothetical protein